MIRSEAFPSRWLKAPDLKGQPCVLEIVRTEQETVKFDGREQKKTVLYFKGTGKALQVNMTIWDAIEAITGKADSKDWPGTVIEVFPTTTEVKGDTVDCVRVRAPAQGDLLAAAKPKLPPAPTSSNGGGNMDDEIPF
jgi:hypothetical protein